MQTRGYRVWYPGGSPSGTCRHGAIGCGILEGVHRVHADILTPTLCKSQPIANPSLFHTKSHSILFHANQLYRALIKGQNILISDVSADTEVLFYLRIGVPAKPRKFRCSKLILREIMSTENESLTASFKCRRFSQEIEPWSILGKAPKPSLFLVS